MPTLTAELSRARAVAGDWDEKKAGGSLASEIGKEQVEKGLHFICTFVRSLGERRPEKCKAFGWLNSPAIPGILSYFYLVLRKMLCVLQLFVVRQC